MFELLSMNETEKKIKKTEVVAKKLIIKLV